MTQTKHLSPQPIHLPALAKRMLTGAGIALILIAIFLIPVRNPDPAWGKFWMARPFIIVTLAGAAGGAFYYLMGPFRRLGGWSRFWANALCLVVYVIGLWLGTVLSLNGTLWN